MNHYAASLDIGSSKVALAVGEKTDAGIRIVSYHDAPSAGVQCGEIINDFRIAEVVRVLVQQTEAELDEKLSEVTVGISGRVLHREDHSSFIKRRNASSSISEAEVQRIIRAQYETTSGDEEMVFEATLQRYSTEDRIGITQDELIGMVGSEIVADFILFKGRKSILNRRSKVLDECGLKMNKAILAPIASARAVLSAREMERGVVLVDIGAETTEVAIIKDNLVRHVAIIPFGGETVTGDIKTDTGITHKWAESVKILQGRCCEEYAVENRKLMLKDENGNVEDEVDLVLLTRIIEARMSEIFDAVGYVIDQSDFAKRLPAGVVITGGTAHLDNILQLASSLLERKVRLAAPQGSISSGSVNEAFDVYSSTAVGLILETLDPKLSSVLEQKQEVVLQDPEPPVDPPKKSRNGLFGGRGKGSKGVDENPKQPSIFDDLFKPIEEKIMSQDNSA